MKAKAVVLTAVAGLALTATVGVAQERSVRTAKQKSATAFYLASDSSVRGFEAISVNRDQTIYAAPQAVLTGADVVGMETFESRTGTEVSLTLTDAATARLEQDLGKQSADMLALFTGNHLVAFGPLTFDASTGTAIVGGLDSSNARRVTTLLEGGTVVPAGPTITLVASKPTIQPGETVTVEVFADGFADLRAYQATLAIEGGSSGALKVSDLWIDRQRADWIFTGVEAVEAVDKIGGRMGAVLWQGGVSTPQPQYLGTFEVTALDAASGSFDVRLRTDQASIFWSSENEDVPYNTSPIQITVGTASKAGRLGAGQK